MYYILKLLGTFPHTLNDTALYVRPDYRPQGIWPGKGLVAVNIRFWYRHCYLSLVLQPLDMLLIMNTHKHTLSMWCPATITPQDLISLLASLALSGIFLFFFLFFSLKTRILKPQNESSSIETWTNYVLLKGQTAIFIIST